MVKQLGLLLVTCLDSHLLTRVSLLCVSVGLQWYLGSGERFAVCELCHPTCLSCSGPLAANCQSCAPGLYLTQDTCQTECAIR